MIGRILEGKGGKKTSVGGGGTSGPRRRGKGKVVFWSHGIERKNGKGISKSRDSHLGSRLLIISRKGLNKHLIGPNGEDRRNREAEHWGACTLAKPKGQSTKKGMLQ